MNKFKGEPVPISILGYTGIVKHVYRITIQDGAIHEELEYRGGQWFYNAGKRSISVDHDTMDAILITWYTRFDNGNGTCEIIIRRYDSFSPVIKYKN